MARKLQIFRHTETTYNRPNQNWTCGRECEGVSCALGPDALGRCRAGVVTEGEHPRTTGECIPTRGEYNKFTGETTNTNRWFCTREASNGGPCDDGPRPDGSCCRPVSSCRPEASLRRKRGTFTICVVGLTVATILIFFAKKPEALNHPLNPGPISATHSTAGITCADCHVDPSVSLTALSNFHSTAINDSSLCLKCHQEIGTPGDAKVFAAHTLPTDHLDLLTQKAQAARPASPTPVMLKLTNIVAKNHESMACATCHQEHHGKHVDLTDLSNNQCQVCHTGQFHSFSSGHPEFTSYPYRRKTRIFFDHDTHFREYFKNADVAEHAMTSCSQCHTENSDGRMMATGSYEKTCAACHDSDTRFDQWSILAFPKIDTGNLASQIASRPATEDLAKLDDWKSAKARELSPLIKILLDDESGKASEELSAALKTLRATKDGLQLRRFRNASDEQKEAGVTVTSAVLNKIYGDDDDAFKQLLSQSRWLEGAALEDRKRLGENLADVFSQLRSRSAAPAGGTEPDSESVASTTDFGGVFSYDRPTGALSYKPGGHADPFLKAALDATAAKVSEFEAADELFGEISNYLAGFDSTAAGKCLKCHTVDEREDGTLAVNWSPAGQHQVSRPITHFKHRSHVRLPELVRGNAMANDESCASCHVLGQSAERIAEYRAFFSGGSQNPHQFRSGFENLALNSCASCHTPEKAGDNCQLCHQYHATPSPLEPNFTAILAGKADTDAAPATGEVPNDTHSAHGTAEGDSLVPDEGDSLVPDEGDSLVPDEGDSLIPDEGDSLIPDEGDSLIPDEGDSLIPDEGDSLISDEGDSLIPDEGEDSGSELLLPE